MRKLVQEQLKYVLFGVPGVAVGILIAHLVVQERIRSDLVRLGWVDSTGLNGYYGFYAIIGYCLSIGVGALLQVYLRRRKSRVNGA